MELTVSFPEPEALKSLTDLEQYYVKLKHEPPLAKLKDGQRKKLCVDIITLSLVEQSPNGQSDYKIIQAQSELLYKELSGKYLSLTPSELKEAFKLGIRGESGPYFGMCPKTYSQFIKWWFEKSDRNKAFDKYVDKVSGWKRAEKPMVPKEKFFEACERAYQKYKKTGEMVFGPFSYYDFIKDYLGLSEKESLMDKEKWPDIKKSAKILYKDRVTKLEKVYSINVERDWSNESKNQLMQTCIKEIGIRYFFDNLIYLGKERIKD